MKIGIVKANLLRESSLRAQDYLCPNDALEKDIQRLERSQRTLQTTLRNKRLELTNRREAERKLIAAGDLTLIPENPEPTCRTRAPLGEWSWVPAPDGNLRLISPTGHEAATVFKTGTWFIWGPDGEGGQNDVGKGHDHEAVIEDAKWCATHAAKVLWYESGWVDPVTLESLLTETPPDDEGDDNVDDYFSTP